MFLCFKKQIDIQTFVYCSKYTDNKFSTQRKSVLSVGNCWCVRYKSVLPKKLAPTSCTTTGSPLKRNLHIPAKNTKRKVPGTVMSCWAIHLVIPVISQRMRLALNRPAEFRIAGALMSRSIWWVENSPPPHSLSHTQTLPCLWIIENPMIQPHQHSPLSSLPPLVDLWS